MAERELIPTRITLLELKDERRMVREGFALLDEKRMLLASEILKGLARYGRLRTEWLAALADARAALAAAIRRHGFDGLAVHPGRPGTLASLDARPHGLLGLRLVETSLELASAPPEFPPAATSPEVEECVRRFARLAELAAAMAGLAASLRIMAADYVRTERRARALENVLLPEIEGDMGFVESQLEAIDQEETLRVREARRRT